MNKRIALFAAGFLVILTALPITYSAEAKNPPSLNIDTPEVANIGTVVYVTVRVSNLEENEGRKIRLAITDPLGRSTNLDLITNKEGIVTHKFNPDIFGKWRINALLISKAHTAWDAISIDVVRPFVIRFGPPPDPLILDMNGDFVTDISVGQQVRIAAPFTSPVWEDVHYIAIMQVKDSDGFTTNLSWVTGIATAGQTLKPEHSWTPERAGDFLIELFTWKSLDEPIAYSPVRSILVTVSE
jgi:hypothetical protein